MSIRKKKAEAIIGGLMVDLAASGAFDALAIVKQARLRWSDDGDRALLAAPLPKFEKRAWTIENPGTNFYDALRNIQSALTQVNSSLEYLPMLARSGNVKDSTVLSNELKGFQKKLLALAASFEKEAKSFDKSEYWKNTAPLFLRGKHKEIKAMTDAASKNKIIFSTFLDSPVADSVRLMIENLSDATDEIENALDALDEPLEGPSASRPDAAPASAATGASPSRAYDEYILGGKRALEEFFEKYPVEQDPRERGSFNKEAYDIVKKNIIDNREVQALMRHTDISSDAKDRLIRTLRFSDAAKSAYEAVIAQIEKASAELDQLRPTLPGG